MTMARNSQRQTTDSSMECVASKSHPVLCSATGAKIVNGNFAQLLMTATRRVTRTVSDIFQKVRETSRSIAV